MYRVVRTTMLHSFRIVLVCTLRYTSLFSEEVNEANQLKVSIIINKKIIFLSRWADLLFGCRDDSSFHHTPVDCEGYRGDVVVRRKLFLERCGLSLRYISTSDGKNEVFVGIKVL